MQKRLVRKSIFKQYRIVPLVLVGMLSALFLYGASLLIWTLVCYLGNIEPALNGLPGFIWFTVVFLSCGLMTLLIKGGTVFPSVIVSLAAGIIAVCLYQSETLLVGNLILKIILTLLVGICSFTVVKLLLQLRKKKKSENAVSQLIEPNAESDKEE